MFLGGFKLNKWKFCRMKIVLWNKQNRKPFFIIISLLHVDLCVDIFQWHSFLLPPDVFIERLYEFERGKFLFLYEKTPRNRKTIKFWLLKVRMDGIRTEFPNSNGKKTKDTQKLYYVRNWIVLNVFMFLIALFRILGA